MKLKKISDPEQLDKIIRQIFMKKGCRLHENGGHFPVRLLGYQANVLQIAHRRNPGHIRLLVLKHKEYWMMLECHVESRASGNREMVKPVCLHIKEQIRREPRTILDAGARAVMFDIIPLKRFPDLFNAENRIRDRLLKAYHDGLAKRYLFSDIKLLKTMRMDLRMRLFNRFFLPIYAPDVYSGIGWKGEGFIPYGEYSKIVGIDFPGGDLVSEISVPLIYNRLVAWGYLRVFSESMLTMTDLEELTQTASDLAREFEDQSILPGNPEICVVLDVSRQGLGFAHANNAHLSPYYVPGEDIIFKLKFGEEEAHPFYGAIKNTRMIAGNYRIGVEFKMLNSQSESYLERLLKAARN